MGTNIDEQLCLRQRWCVLLHDHAGPCRPVDSTPYKPGQEFYSEAEAQDAHFYTFSGLKVYYFRPTPYQFHISDIARGLAMEPRYNGQTRRHYSVAEHCLHLSHITPEHLQRRALLHDRAEAYIKDLPRPLKMALRDYRLITDRIDEASAVMLMLPSSRDEDLELQQYDNCIIHYEAVHLGLKNINLTCQPDPGSFRPEVIAACEKIKWDWYEHSSIQSIMATFALRYNQLTRKMIHNVTDDSE